MSGDGSLAPRMRGINFQPSQLYESLPLARGSRTIRLLDLDSETANSRGQLHATMRVMSLESSPQYAALSYVWKDNLPGKVVTCNGCDIKITNSCYEALCTLIKRYGNLTIWVDALCINQDDLNEKATQIPLMEDVYTWAQPTFVWLGPSDTQTDRVFNNLRQAAKTQLPSSGIPWHTGTRIQTVLSDCLSIAARIIFLWWALMPIGKYLSTLY